MTLRSTLRLLLHCSVASIFFTVGCSEFSGEGDTSGDLIAPEVSTDIGDGGVVPPDTGGPDGEVDGGPGPDVTGSGDAIWVPDGAPSGTLGSPCSSNEDCNSGYCIEGPTGQMCTKTCIEECPTGFSCKPISSAGDPVYICVYEHITYCRPCNTNADCAHPLISGAGAVCVDSGTGDGSFCSTRCDGGSPCPSGGFCDNATIDGTALEICRPLPGEACECSLSAIEAGATTSCASSNTEGTCEGTRTCAADGLTECDAPTPVAELCNNIDDDCDGAVDETFSAKGQPCDGGDADSCEDGVLNCMPDGTLGCDDDLATQPELCNDVDDDCDGEIDEQFNNKGLPCDGNDVDLCADGVFVCDASGGIMCNDDLESSVESCNNIDDDCDGEIDEDFPTLGTPCDGDDTDSCANGQWACAGDGSGGLECANDTADATFVDLDGAGGLAPGDSCGVGACAGGTVVCADGAAMTCSSHDMVGEELCDGIDNDCDGLIDEDFADGGTVVYDDGTGSELHLGEACGTGACSDGVVVCGDDQTSLSCSTLDMVGTEICDGLDNDCDGSIDEDYAPGGSVTFNDLDGTMGLAKGEACGVGACGGGVVACAPGGGSLMCTTSDQVSDDVCDGIDNDCDGIIDEAYAAGGSVTYIGPEGGPAKVKGDSCGAGACDGGTVVCGADMVTLTCSTADTASPDVCDSIDNDCDGQVDEDFVNGGTVTYDDPGGDSGLTLGDECGAGACDGGIVICADATTLTCSNAAGGGEICDDIDNDCDGEVDEGCDKDGDNYCDAGMQIQGSPAVCTMGGNDCNDDDAMINPAAAEICDDIDNNCVGGTDEGCDDDGDGYCDASVTLVGSPAVCANGGGDCDDTSVAISPAANELCDNVDNNCAGGVDEGCDDDGDQYCDALMVVIGSPDVCPLGIADCDDEQPSVYPTAPESCDDLDNDCNAVVDQGCDDDGDGFCDAALNLIGSPAICPNGGNDCNDGSPTVNPAATEICDNINNDCAGGVDDGCDEDDDGYCAASMVVIGTPTVCGNGGGDCNDAEPSINPGETEICDDVDNNCAMGVDEGCDDDGDNFCDSTKVVIGTPAVCPLGGGDCNDTVGSVNPAASEICDNIDNNCADGVDETCDLDGDNYCNASIPIVGTPAACPNGGGDCNDSAPGVNPGASEVCDDVDNNCVNGADEGCDDDNDGFCDAAMPLIGSSSACPNGGGDCVDTNDNIKPGAPEICDDIDNNCSSVVDENCDGDGDGWCDAGAIVSGSPAVCSLGVGDCNDAEFDINPGATEVCDDINNNCTGGTDEGCDDDDDNFCDSAMVVVGTPSVCLLGGGDCDDTETAVNPNGIEVCDDIDNNCAGGVDEPFTNGTVTYDLDPSGPGKVKGDSCGVGACTGGVVICAPGGVTLDCSTSGVGGEICDNVDNDCNGTIDDGCDSDGDGYCDASMTILGSPDVCPSGGNDCNDDNNAINPGATEICDDVDNNCVAGIDELCDDDGDDYCDANIAIVGTPSVCPNGGGDCLDSNDGVNPGAAEQCDGLDNNCVGGSDEGCDDDGDDYCDANMVTVGSPAVCPNGGNDCNDSSAAVNPAAGEICDNIDNDCGEGVDEGCDDDNDNYCDAGMVMIGTPSTCTAGGNDCNDGTNTINPGVSEICDSIDNNCNNQIDEGCDDDNDNYCDANMVTVGLPNTCTGGGGDCQDTNPDVNPGEDELCNNADDNCSGNADDATPLSMCGSPNNATPTCSGMCGLVCNAYFNDLNGNFGDGCECAFDNNDIAGNGDTCANAIPLSNLDDNGEGTSVSGTLHSTGDVDWYSFQAIDLAPNGPNDTYDVVIDFSLNPGNQFQFDVIRGGTCTTTPQCTAETLYEWFTNFNNGEISGEGNCVTPNDSPFVAGINGRNHCDDDTATYRVRVFRDPGATPTCASYTLRVSNGQ